MTAATVVAAPPRTHHLGVALVALACGGFAIGTTEFVSMGLLPELARSVGVDNATAGHAISAYALGVVVGAPVMAFMGARWPRKAVLLGLMALFALGNAATALVGSYDQLLVARLVSGLPHGAYFGVASLVAATLAPPGRAGRAVATVMLGLSVANVVGVPAATWLGQTFGWQAAYYGVAALGLLTMALVAWVIPHLAGDPDASWRREIGALRRPQVLLALLTGAVGFGGMFAVITYIRPVLSEVGGIDKGLAPLFLMVFGLGMVFGTWLAGRLSEWSENGSLIGSTVAQVVLLVLFSVLAPTGWGLLPVLFGITTASSVLVVNLQLRLMRVSGDAQTMGAAMNHASLNMANALGAWIGGIVLAAGWGLASLGYVGASLSVLGLLVLLWARWLEKHPVTSAAT